MTVIKQNINKTQTLKFSFDNIESFNISYEIGGMCVDIRKMTGGISPIDTNIHIFKNDLPALMDIFSRILKYKSEDSNEQNINKGGWFPF